MTRRHIVIGGGAAGFFGAIACAEQNPSDEVIILEKSLQLLSKVRISGGGRCNVTHACFDPRQLVMHYPRGSKELLGPFHRFQPKDTMQWFHERGVELKVEDDGRVFPATDSSETIINCLFHEAKKWGVKIKLQSRVTNIERLESHFLLDLSNGEKIQCDTLLIASGSTPKMVILLEKLGHHIEPLVPSLFTFNLPSSPLSALLGVTVEDVEVKIKGTTFAQRGPLLITHWGLSGPAVLKLSAWAARYLHGVNYKALLVVNWIPDITDDDLQKLFEVMKIKNPNKRIGSDSPVNLPKQLWKKLTSDAVDIDQRWVDISKVQSAALIKQLRAYELEIDGKTTYKQEFVTCGGVTLKEVNFKTMESRLCPKLFFAGEVLDIDGVTGGFNFQNAWTTGWIAGHAMGEI